MQFVPDDVLLARYWAARDAGDRRQAAALWEQLIVQNFDRIKQIVKAFRFSPGGKGLPDFEWGSAASEAYIRANAMGVAFRERDIGQFCAALYRCVHNVCLDYGRKELRHERRAAGSVDQTYEPDGEAGPFDAALARYDADRRAEASDSAAADQRAANAERLVHWGIGQVGNDNYREVLELTWRDKLPAEDIAERIGISLDNVYARRSRGLKELETILRGIER